MLIVSPLRKVYDVWSERRPSRVISLLSQDESVPAFEGLNPDFHLKLYVERDACAATISDAAKGRAEEIIRFSQAWDGVGDIMLHCNRGVSRSMAAAFIILCMRDPNKAEALLAASLRRAAPHADPCPLIVSHADDLLDRDGRMLDAIEDLPPPCADTAAPVVTLPLAA